MKITIIISLMILSFSSYASLSRYAFQSEINNFETVMSPKIEEEYGLPVVIKMYWNVNLRALSEGGNGGARFLKTETGLGAMIVGGVARDPLMNKNALNFILCHELGHSVNFEKVIPQERDEDAADHFAVTKCLPYLWAFKDSQDLNESMLDAIHLSMLFIFNQFELYKPHHFYKIDETREIKATENILDLESKNFIRCRYERLLFWVTQKKNQNTKTCLAGKFKY